MEYEAKGPIYLQISDVVCENIMAERWQEGSRIPSVRELAVEAEVNPNTVMRTYSHLQDQRIVLFHCPGSPGNIADRKDDAIFLTIPDIEVQGLIRHHSPYVARSVTEARSIHIIGPK